jgi:hypothetical protein
VFLVVKKKTPQGTRRRTQGTQDYRNKDEYIFYFSTDTILVFLTNTVLCERKEYNQGIALPENCQGY